MIRSADPSFPVKIRHDLNVVARRYLVADYSLCQREHIAPYIDLNLGNTRKTSDFHGVTIGPDGIPICKAGLKMKSNGNDLRQLYAKFRCPLNNNGITFSESNPYF